MTKRSILCGILLLSLIGIVSATNLTIGDAHELGFVQFGIPSGDADRTAYVDVLTMMLLGTTFDDRSGTTGQFYTRSNNDFGPLAPAVFGHDGTGTSVDLGSGGFGYLFAKYDGPNFGSEVWDVSGLTGTVTIPAFGSGNKFGLSGWTLFNPGGAVPEPSTYMLLGVGILLCGQRFLRLRKKA